MTPHEWMDVANGKWADEQAGLVPMEESAQPDHGAFIDYWRKQLRDAALCRAIAAMRDAR